MSFSSIAIELQKKLGSNLPQIRFLLKRNPGMAFTTINEITANVGKRYNVKLSLNFPERGKIDDFESYGTENIGIVFQRDSKTFPISRELIKSKALEILGSVQIEDAYMYEGKEGVRVNDIGYRLDILPSSLHVWGKISKNICKFCDWLLENCYEVKPAVAGAFNKTSS